MGDGFALNLLEMNGRMSVLQKERTGYCANSPRPSTDRRYLPMPSHSTPEERFWSKVNKNGPLSSLVPGRCWVWLGYTRPKGYGDFEDETLRIQKAHRWAYLKFRGPIPEGFHVHHRCCNPSCVNPFHLQAVSPTENAYLSQVWMNGFRHQKAKTHCPQGHPYDEANTYIWGNNYRQCRTCHRQRKGAERKRAT